MQVSLDQRLFGDSLRNNEKWIEWLSTAILLLGVALNSFNIYPLGIWVSLTGNAGWIILGYIWRKNSLIFIQIVLTVIYIIGLINHYIMPV